MAFCAKCGLSQALDTKPWSRIKLLAKEEKTGRSAQMPTFRTLMHLASVIAAGALIIAVPPIVAAGRNGSAIEPAASAIAIVVSVERQAPPPSVIATVVAVFAVMFEVVVFAVPLPSIGVVLAFAPTP
jgi:hypothetical protein